MARSRDAEAGGELAMKRMSVTEVKRNFSSVLRRVASGESIEVTRRGVTAGKIQPHPAVLARIASQDKLVGRRKPTKNWQR
ncbi:MAG: type II toxin-antitoxin system Phd/YefM family antitoxin [Rhodospirillales bacterium]